VIDLSRRPRQRDSAGLNIAVCGAGPAGLAAALFLHRDGHRARIFERFAQPQPVGSGLLLQPTGLAVLQQLGLAQELLSLGAPITALQGCDVLSGRRSLNVRYDSIGPGWEALGIHRAALFNALHGAVVAAGIPMECGQAIVRDDARLKGFDLVVDALGAHSPLALHQGGRRVLEYGALWINIPWPGAAFQADRLDQRYAGARRMAGLMPIGRLSPEAVQQAAFFWSLRRSDLAHWQQQPQREWLDEVSALWPELQAPLADCQDKSAFTFAAYDHYTLRQPHAANCVQIGDAAHATSPQLGQGANMALLDAMALALALRESGGVPAALAHYAQLRRWHVRLFQWSSALFTPFYQSDSTWLPRWRDYVLAPLTRLPVLDSFVARLVAGMTVAPLAGRDFAPFRRSSSS
jgi:2-polyprenyl-6-methoxyphenol hydroxylase-like FAD-dependent oxidoreductase